MNTSSRDHHHQLLRRHMEQAELSPLVCDTFLANVARMQGGDSGMIPQAGILPPTGITEYGMLPAPDRMAQDVLARTVLVKLNGGLGTSMGLESAKSLLTAKAGRSFLDIIAHHVLHLRSTYQVHLPVLFMNSFRTHDDTLQQLAAVPELISGQCGLPYGFLQNKVPKLDAETLEPARWPEDESLTWCPPGHGDIYTAMITSGVLQQIREAGYRYASISNADNLGATLDLRILQHFAASGSPFMMEVTKRTEADRKGGHLAKSPDGRLILRERAQCPAEEFDAFEDTKRYRFFNTNNLWIDLDALTVQLARHEDMLLLPLIVNRKHLDPADPSTPRVIQLETAMGSAISVFPGATALQVPRTRFAPVKTTEDLLAIRSDAYELTDDYRVLLSQDRSPPPPTIHLDPTHYRLLPDFEARFLHGPPSLIGCDSLRVEGDVCFGPNVVLTGNVILRNRTTEQVRIEATRIEGDGTPINL